jgi:mono/diheme cytochrome c family protein
VNLHTVTSIRRTLGSLCLSVGIFALAACSARRGEPVIGRLAPLTPDERAGEELFMHLCHQCHPGGMAGLGPSLNDKPLPGFLVRTQVREGLGAMPSFDEDELNDADLDQLVAFVGRLREGRD